MKSSLRHLLEKLHHCKEFELPSIKCQHSHEFSWMVQCSEFGHWSVLLTPWKNWHLPTIIINLLYFPLLLVLDWNHLYHLEDYNKRRLRTEEKNKQTNISLYLLKKKTLMVGKIEGKRKRGQQRMIRLDSNTDSMDMNRSKLQETVKDRKPGMLHPWGHKESDTTASEQQSIFNL